MRTTIVLALAALVFTACGGSEEPSGGGAVLPDGDWELIDGMATVGGFPITLSISGDDASGRAACNSYFGTVTVDGDAIRFSELGQTAMGCEPAVMDAETLYQQGLQAVDTFSIDGTRLTLRGAGVEFGFEPVPVVPTAALTETEWMLETLIEGETAASVAGNPATLLLASDGTITASTGCRTLIGRWLESGGVVVVPELSADGECPDDLWKQDSLVVTVIGDEFRAQIDGNVLTLTSMGDDGLVYRATE